MSIPFVQNKGELQAYAVEPSNTNEHHLRTDDATLPTAPGSITEQSQYGLATVGGKRVLVGPLQFSISGCTPSATNVQAKQQSCTGRGIIVAGNDSLLSSNGLFALKEGDEGQCFGVATSIYWPYPPVPVLCRMCIEKGQSLQPTILQYEEARTTDTIDSKGMRKTEKKQFFAKLIRSDGSPICNAEAIAKPIKGDEVKGITNEKGEVTFVLDSEECDIRFPEYDVSHERPMLSLGKSKAEDSNRLLQKGSQSSEVMALQLRLNARLQPSPRLIPDGIFGDKTEKAVIEFQKTARIDSDGIVGPITRQVMAARPNVNAPDELQKFIPQLGTVSDFQKHIEQVWSASVMSRERFFSNTGIKNFGQAIGTNKRYLLVEGDPVAVVDFRHFFAAASLSYSNQRHDAPIGGSDGKTELAGLGNELSQCISEGLESKMNSCFSREDLGSNRLGAAFGHKVRLDQRETPVPQLFTEFIVTVKPLSPDRLSQVQLPSRWDLFLESLMAIVHGLDDLLIPEAY
ncbi:peptidoglycan-binding domain-containing protein [Pirellulaceae bacterium SH501]